MSEPTPGADAQPDTQPDLEVDTVLRAADQKSVV